jgi:hypothetical protein
MLQHVSVEVRPEQVDACVAFWALRWFTRDPAGNHVELMSAPPPTGQPRPCP